MGPDSVHDCGRLAAGSALRCDSVPKMGDWSDFTGSGEVANPELQGMGTKASGKRMFIDNIDTVNVHGKRQSTHRLRRHEEYIDIEVK